MDHQVPLETTSLYGSKRDSRAPLLSNYNQSEYQSPFRSVNILVEEEKFEESAIYTAADNLPPDEVIQINSEKMDDYEILLDKILCSMFVSQSSLRKRNQDLNS
jgi:hypothetical protein